MEHGQLCTVENSTKSSCFAIVKDPDCRRRARRMLPAAYEPAGAHGHCFYPPRYLLLPGGLKLLLSTPSAQPRRPTPRFRSSARPRSPGDERRAAESIFSRT